MRAIFALPFARKNNCKFQREMDYCLTGFGNAPSNYQGKSWLQ